MVNNVFNKKLAEFFDKMDDKMLKIKLNSAIDMLKKAIRKSWQKRSVKLTRTNCWRRLMISTFPV